MGHSFPAISVSTGYFVSQLLWLGAQGCPLEPTTECTQCTASVVANAMNNTKNKVTRGKQADLSLGQQ